MTEKLTETPELRTVTKLLGYIIGLKIPCLIVPVASSFTARI